MYGPNIGKGSASWIYYLGNRIAVISPRDQYLIGSYKIIQANESKTGKKQYICGSRSKELPEYPHSPGYVRA